jgi:glycosyltransferase involved in cell wall biosynthesis
MKILFLHPNMPGQYKHLARAFGDEGGHQIIFLTKHKSAEIAGVKRITYTVKRTVAAQTHGYLRTTEQAVLQGQEVWRQCNRLKQQGFVPDIIIGHPGWGDGLFIKDIFPQTPCLFLHEFYYRADGADVGFDPAEIINDDDRARMRMRNITNNIVLDVADVGICPTWWQYSLNPPEYRHKLHVLHEGIDVNLARPNAAASYTTPAGKIFTRADKVVTYIARNFEPYRGFPTFMQAAEILLKQRPDIHIIAVGADAVSYGKKAPEGQSYRQIWQQKLQLDSERIHFVGRVNYDNLMQILQLSSAHLYLTYPFVLSWSLLEAMACGVPLVASDTKPLREAVTHEQQGLLVDFFKPEEVAAQALRLLDDTKLRADLGAAARARAVERYDLQKILPLYMQLVREMAACGGIPPVTAQFPLINPRQPQAFWGD